MSQMVPPTAPFPGSLTHLEASRWLRNGPFPRQNWLKICEWTSKPLLDVDLKAGKSWFLGPKISLRHGVIVIKTKLPSSIGYLPNVAKCVRNTGEGNLIPIKILDVRTKWLFHSNCLMQRQTQNALFFSEASSPEAITLGANYARSSLNSIRYH